MMTAHRVDTILMAVAILRHLEIEPFRRNIWRLWAEGLEEAVVNDDLKHVTRIKRSLLITGNCEVDPNVRLMSLGVARLLMSDA